MKTAAKRNASPEVDYGFFKRRRKALIGGLWLATTLVLSPIDLTSFYGTHSESASQPHIDTEAKYQDVPVSKVNFGISVAVDCPLANSGKQTGLYKMSNEAYRPLQMASQNQGMDKNAYIFMGQRAPNAPAGAPPERGMLFNHDSGSGNYSIFSFHTVYDNNAEPSVHIEPKSELTLNQLMKGVEQTYEGVNARITYDSTQGDRAFHFNVSCELPPSR